MGRRCQQAGCRAWARRNHVYCAAHAQHQGTAGTALEAPARDQRVERVASDLERGASDGVEPEIAAARLAQARLLRDEADPLRLAEGLARVAGVVLKARKLEHEAGGDGLGDEAARRLRELGLGEH